MKNLANCTPIEFLKQTNKIRHEVESWLKDTKIMDIRKNRPVLIPLTPSMTEEEMESAKKENRERTRKQTYLNISDMLDAALENHTEQTLRVLALMCFIEPENANDHKPVEYLNAFTEIFSDKDVLDFFTSLMRLEQINTSDSVNQ